MLTIFKGILKKNNQPRNFRSVSTAHTFLSSSREQYPGKRCIDRQVGIDFDLYQTVIFAQNPARFFSSTRSQNNILVGKVIEEPLENLEQLRNLQGKIITLEEIAKQLHNFQLGFIAKSLERGFEHFKLISSNKCIHEAFYKWMLKFFNFVTKVTKGFFLNNPEEFNNEQNYLYELFHKDQSLLDEEKLFLEFMLGLARFDLSVQIINCFYAHLLKVGKLKTHLSSQITTYPYIDQHNFFLRLDSVVELVRAIHKESNSAFTHNLDEYWIYIDDFFHKHKNIERLAQHLASMQYIPQNKHLITIAQILHWNGFGSNGSFFDKFPLMNNIKTQAFYYHAEMANVTSRVNLMQRTITHLTEHSTNVVAFVLTGQFSEDEYNVKDVCSGPDYAAVQPLFRKLPNKSFRLHVSDVDGTSILSLLKKSKEVSKDRLFLNVNIDEVRYEDYNFPLEINNSDLNKFHMVSARLGLHQIAKEDVYQVYRYFASIVKVGGIIVNLEVTTQRHFQIILAPTNIIDREGYVTESKRMDLLQLATPMPKCNTMKLAYPLHKLQKRFPFSVSERDNGIYIFNIFTVVEMPLKLINRLAFLWNNGLHDECDKLVSENGNKLVVEQDQIVEATKQQMEPTFKSPRSRAYKSGGSCVNG